MSKIEFLALGGQDEHGKECYALNVGGDIYIINCGIATPPAISLGIKKVIPDFAWINENKRNIKGIFIGTPTYQHFGGLEFLHPFLPEIPIYVTDVGCNILRTYFEQRAIRHELKPIKLNIRIIEPMKTETIGQCLVTPFKISNSMPRSVGFVFTTKDGCIIYIDDFIYSANRNISFEDQVSLINQITKNNNLLLLVGVGQTSKNSGFTNPSHRCIKYFNSLLIDAPGKVVVGIFEDDFYKVLSLCMAASQLNRPICFASKSDEFTFEQLRQKQYFNSKNQLIHLDQLDKTENAILIVIGTQQHLFTKLRKIITGDNPLITIKSTDSFIFAAPTIPGYETMEAQLFDDVDRTNLFMIHKLDKNILSVSASAEDQKLLVEFLHPKYIIPISGLYMNFIDYQKHVLATGFNKTDILFVENGQIISWNNGALETQKKILKLEPQFIGSSGVLDTGASSIFEREQMKENGAVLVSFLLDKNTKSIKHFNYDVVGVVELTDENKNIVNSINAECNKQIGVLITSAFQHTPMDLKNLKIMIRKIVDKQYERKFNKRPLILTTIIFNKDYNTNQESN